MVTKAAKEKPGPREVKKGPRQQRLPEMEDPKIEALEDIAMSYAEVRDERMGLSAKEIELKNELHDLMKARKKTRYKRGNILIEIVHEKENVKVRVRPQSDDEADGEDDE